MSDDLELTVKDGKNKEPKAEEPKAKEPLPSISQNPSSAQERHSLVGDEKNDHGERERETQAASCLPIFWWKMFLAECLGTATLVFLGCGAVTTNNSSLSGVTTNVLAIAFTFGIAIIAMAYGIGHVSGCHINPAVSFGATVAGRMCPKLMLVYWCAQFIGGILGAATLVGMMQDKAFFQHLSTEYQFGANGWGSYQVECAASDPSPKCVGGVGEWTAYYGAGYDIGAAFGVEVLTTFLFLIVILGVTGKEGNNKFAGLAIGMTLVGIHVVSIPITGTSVNPARSLGPAIMAEGLAIQQVWLFIVAPLIGALAAGIAYHPKVNLCSIKAENEDE